MECVLIWFLPIARWNRLSIFVLEEEFLKVLQHNDVPIPGNLVRPVLGEVAEERMEVGNSRMQVVESRMHEVVGLNGMTLCLLVMMVHG